ncbi:hypothetical protein IWQ55_000031 [Labrenzia sp. EL_208]|nr:hypothetical protein [Labrenzia sp. EL_132]MBG6226839.1 hypothetical protein [Labrenzia sp. EL_208]
MAGNREEQLEALRNELQELKGQAMINTVVSGFALKAAAEVGGLDPQSIELLRTDLNALVSRSKKEAGTDPNEDSPYCEGMSKTISHIFDGISVEKR